MVNQSLRDRLQWNFNPNLYIFIKKTFLNIVCKMVAILSQSQCVKDTHSSPSCLDHFNVVKWDFGILATQLFVQQLVQTNIKENIKAPLALCEGNPLVNSRFHSQRTSNEESISISLHHHTAASPHRRGVMWMRIPWNIIIMAFCSIQIKPYVCYAVSARGLIYSIHNKQIVWPLDLLAIPCECLMPKSRAHTLSLGPRTLIQYKDVILPV